MFVVREFKLHHHVTCRFAEVSKKTYMTKMFVSDDTDDTTEEDDTTGISPMQYDCEWLMESTDDLIRRSRLEMARNIILLKTNHDATDDEAQRLADQLAVEAENELDQLHRNRYSSIVSSIVPTIVPTTFVPTSNPTTTFVPSPLFPPQQLQSSSTPSSPILTYDGRWVQPKQWPTLV